MAEEKEKKYIWLDKKDFLKSGSFPIILKILYYGGLYRFKDLTDYAEKHKESLYLQIRNRFILTSDTLLGWNRDGGIHLCGHLLSLS